MSTVSNLPTEFNFAKLTVMLPVVATIGKLVIPSFGLFLAISFLVGTFLVWRLARAWDLNEEKVLDLTLLSFFGGLFGSRIHFALTHLEFFLGNPIRLFLINIYPGFSFWGGLILGSICLIFFAKRLKLDFLQVADMAAVSFLGALVIGNIGCFLGGCGVGIESKLFFATPVVGLVGNRIPVQIIEGVLLYWLFSRLWVKAKKFHTPGRVLASSLIGLGLIKVMVEPLRDPKTYQNLPLTGFVLSLVLIFLGISLNYRLSKKNLLRDLRSFPREFLRTIVNGEYRKIAIDRFKTLVYTNTVLLLYNKKIEWSWKFKNFGKLLKKLHVKSTPKNIKQY